MGVIALAVILMVIIDSCLHNLQEILVWFRAGTWLLEYSQSHDTQASILPIPWLCVIVEVGLVAITTPHKTPNAFATFVLGVGLVAP